MKKIRMTFISAGIVCFYFEMLKIPIKYEYLVLLTSAILIGKINLITIFKDAYDYLSVKKYENVIFLFFIYAIYKNVDKVQNVNILAIIFLTLVICNCLEKVKKLNSTPPFLVEARSEENKKMLEI